MTLQLHDVTVLLELALFFSMVLLCLKTRFGMFDIVL